VDHLGAIRVVGLCQGAWFMVLVYRLLHPSRRQERERGGSRERESWVSSRVTEGERTEIGGERESVRGEEWSQAEGERREGRSVKKRVMGGTSVE